MGISNGISALSPPPQSPSPSWIDTVGNAVAIVWTVVASLRTASRLLYINQHGSIGVLDGPLILPPTSPSQFQPTNSTEISLSTDNDGSGGSSSSSSSSISGSGTSSYSPLFELSEDFRHAVRLSALPDRYRNVQTTTNKATSLNGKNSVDNMTTKKDTRHQQSSYSLGLQPYRPNKFVDAVVDDGDDDVDYEDQVEGHKKDDEVDDLKEIQLELELILDHDSRQRWDYDQAMEGDFLYYQRNPMMPVGSTSTIARTTTTTTSSSSHEGRRSLAELTVHCPETFRNLRNDVFQIPEQEYLHSMLSSGPFVSFQSNSKGAARVGGVFFFTRDGNYMIKTIKQEEASTLLRILPKYHRHYRKYGRSSLLTRFCGMYGVRVYEEEEDGEGERVRDDSDTSSNKIPEGKLYTFIVMNSVFPAEASSFISERFDLKGSTVGREVSEEELHKQGSAAVLKDLDLQREVNIVKSMQSNMMKGKNFNRNGLGDDNDNIMSSREYGLVIGATAKAALLQQLREDVKLLVDCQVMDYSLLVGIVHMDSHRTKHQLARQALGKFRTTERLLYDGPSPSNKKKDSMALYALTMPFRLLLSPPMYLVRRTWDIARLTVDSFVTAPMPYFGSGQCGVDGGKLSILNGKRRGQRAVYYMGLIDFLQPWTTRKVMERKLKGILGYDIHAISSVPPEEYAERFLKFIDDNVC